MITPDLLRYSGFEEAEQILDPVRLSALCGFPVTLLRLRIKPGSSVAVSWRRAEARSAPGGAGSPSDHGWAALFASADKVRGAIRRAERSQVPLLARPSASSAALAGGLVSDPALTRPFGVVADRTAPDEAMRVLAYKPALRATLHLPGRGLVLRLSRSPMTRLMRIGRVCRDAAVPAPDVAPWGHRHTVMASPHWGDGDLGHTRREDAAWRAGRAVAALHGVGPADWPVARPLPSLLPVATQIVGVLPELEERVRALYGELRARRPLVVGPEVPLHGDLSPDQVLHDDLSVRLIDFDRAALGPAGADLGTWEAACEELGAPELAAAFRAGYGPTSTETRRYWVARAHLSRALEPLKSCRASWPAEVVERLARAERALDGENG